MKFRQAVSWAVDKSKIVATCMGGYADVGESILVPSTDDAWTPTDAEKFGYDPEKAKQLLDAAGYKDSNGDGVREDKQGKPIKLRLWTRSESPEQQRAGKLIAGSFESIGIGIELAVMNDGSISDGIWTYKGSTYAPDYDMFIWGWSGNIDPDYMLADFITSQIEMWNDCCWSDKEYDSLYQQQASEMDAATRKDQVTRMQQLFYEQAPYAVLYYPKALIAYNTAKWEGWVPYPSSSGLVVLSGDNIDSYRLVHPVVGDRRHDEQVLEHHVHRDRRHRRDHRDHPRGRARAARPRGASSPRVALPTAGGRLKWLARPPSSFLPAAAGRAHPTRERPPVELLYLSRARRRGSRPVDADVLRAVDGGFAAKGRGQTEMPPKPGVHTRADCFIHAMPAYVREVEVAGLKWVSGYPPNAAKGLPYISGLLVLNDPETGIPIAVMDCAWITAMRTGASVGISAKYLAAAPTAPSPGSSAAASRPAPASWRWSRRCRTARGPLLRPPSGATDAFIREMSAGSPS